MDYIEKFKTEKNLIDQYTINKAFIVWAMGLYLDIADLEQLASDNLTDKGNDHCIDFLRLDREQGVLYIVQGYYTEKVKENAPARKASDLNKSCAWMVSGGITGFPEDMRPTILDFRDALVNNDISHIEIIYLHNCGESKEVNEELTTVVSAFKQLLNNPEIEVHHTQLGNVQLARLFINQAANIAVTAEVECPFSIKFEEQTTSWKSAVLTVNGEWLRTLYLSHHNDLFSANYRGFLGSIKQKINTGMKLSAERTPSNFWAYNNGITILTNSYEMRHGKICLQGISIINGAQTTGTLGSLPSTVSLTDVKIQARIIQSTDPNLINDIVKYNNTQNRITAWDSFSNDPIQTGLCTQFNSFGHDYNIKRGFANRNSIMSVDSCVQPLLAFGGKYKDANRSKTAIFESRSLYSDAFEHRNARHLLLVSCINTAIFQLKSQYRNMCLVPNCSDTEKIVYSTLTNIKAKPFILAIIGESLTKIYSGLTDKKQICFAPNQAKSENYTYQQLVELVKPFVNLLLTHIVHYNSKNLMACFEETPSLPTIASVIENQISTNKSISTDIRRVVDEFGSYVCLG